MILCIFFLKNESNLTPTLISHKFAFTLKESRHKIAFTLEESRHKIAFALKESSWKIPPPLFLIEIVIHIRCTPNEGEETSASTLLSTKQTSSFSFWEIQTTSLSLSLSLSLCLSLCLCAKLTNFTDIVHCTTEQIRVLLQMDIIMASNQICYLPKNTHPFIHFSRMSRIEWGALRRTTMINLSALLCSALLCSALLWTLKSVISQRYFFSVLLSVMTLMRERISWIPSLSQFHHHPQSKFQLQSLSGTIH
jgi:hypothetical protein